MSHIASFSTLRRRGLLFGAASAGLGATAGMSFARAETKGPASELTLSAWSELERALTGGRLLMPGSKDYMTCSNPYNLAYEATRPAGIAYCASAANVQAAIKWCLKYHIQPVARSGGHSYAGYSMTDQLMINTRGIGGSRFDQKSNRVWVGGGALNAEVYALLRQNDATITHGRCPTVGAAGFLLGGGIGFNMRRLGVAADHMRGTEIVLARGGEIVNATLDGPNSDLLWACRGGGGGNFGINTGFWLDTFPVVDIIVFKIQWGFQNGRQMEVAKALMDHLSDAPNGFGSRLSLKARPPKDFPDQTAIDLVGQFTGSYPELMSLLQPAIDADLPTVMNYQTGPYWKGQAFLTDTDGPARFHERSAFLGDKLSPDGLRTAEKFLTTWPNKAVDGQADLRFFQTGGAMNKADHNTSFVHRNSKWLMDIGVSWGETDSVQQVSENIDWQNKFYDAMLPFSTKAAYQNFIDPAETNWAYAYYGSALERLSKVKQQYDPDNLFNFPQSIKPA